LSLLNTSTVASEVSEMCAADTEVHGLIIDLMLLLDYESGQRLDYLRDERNIADYDLSASAPMDVARASVAVQKANFVLSQQLPDETVVDAEFEKIAEIVGAHYRKYRRRRYHERPSEQELP
jgi:hypothetical protein